ncbi:hypothetical protein F8568_036775 [Actinomadura sp. LD22]|uniref:Uncharacterized protein n=1 Tax=Actinomadura physcomitrii TaxID=2650748 RepID=A0A6I4MPM7_9ACTN|nr:hypothetical protein [Actinomadura physcomitrii]MWA05817.1 hypothetical protein [Actinomadura physcomitrii]
MTTYSTGHSITATITFPTLTGAEQGEALQKAGRILKGTYADSAPGRALATVLEALRTGEESATITLNRRDASSLIRCSENTARREGGPADVLLRAVVAALLAADQTANPGADDIRYL